MDLINHQDINVLVFHNDQDINFIINVYSDNNQMAIQALCHDLAKQLSHYLFFFYFSFLLDLLHKDRVLWTSSGTTVIISHSLIMNG